MILSTAGTRPGVHLFDGFQKAGTEGRYPTIPTSTSQNATTGPSMRKSHQSARRVPSSLTRPIQPTEVVRVGAPQRNQESSSASTSTPIFAPEPPNPSPNDDEEQPPTRSQTLVFTPSQRLPPFKPAKQVVKLIHKTRDKGLRSGHKPLEAGDIVLGKLEGYPPWPGHVGFSCVFERK